ncbi:MAG: class I tRNA ligase family protein [Patescibacteria group bacterium]|nr:class I tRNA ligase family protein [Patescibacteria group bacterium]
MNEKKPTKSNHAEREERILKLWKEKDIFEKSLNKPAPKGEFVFYEGPPTANGRPGIHHLEARAFKDAIPRYRTMRGYHVRRKGGWDTHGLPVELAVEKALGLKSKKEIELYGIAAFNEKCKEDVWKYVHEWEQFTDRMGYWVDLKDPYITYKPDYIESVWNVVKETDKRGLLYKDYKVVPWCPRCGTALSSHELAQGYEDRKDLALTVRFKIQDSRFKNGDGNVYLLAWTTTPWTLPGNVALAINPGIDYIKVKDAHIDQLVQMPLDKTVTPPSSKEIVEIFILAKDRFDSLRHLFKNPVVIETFKGSDLVGLEYEPLYPFLKNNASGAEKDKLKNAFKVYAGDFVTTEDGTGIVHIAPMYGQDDFELGTKAGLPKYHLVNDDGTFKKEAGFLAGKFVKDEATDVEIIKDLAGRSGGSLLFHKEKHQHSYPTCWRCHTPLIYFARDSWYIAMSKLRNNMVKENEGIHWEPDYIKEGRFGEWLRDIKDWAISRERYWGTPLPVWACDKCGKRRVVGSVAEIAKKPRNSYWVMRHGQADNNVQNILDSEERDVKVPSHLTDLGKKQALEAVAVLQKIKPDLVFVSPLMRTRETVTVLKEKLGWSDDMVIFDDRIREMGMGEWNGRNINDFYKEAHYEERFVKCAPSGETYADIKKRMGDFLYDIETKYEGKKILVISHETPVFLIMAAAMGLDRTQSLSFRGRRDFIGNAEVRPVDFRVVPHNSEYELDLHKPFIDEVKLACVCGGEMKRAKEVMDVWFDSGCMPFAQDHYPFESQKSKVKSQNLIAKLFNLKDGLTYPADFISEAIDQTRGWFYTLHAVGALMGRGKAYRNVICLGHILDAEGKKMSKHIGNVVSPWDMMDKYGADALRFWMYSVNQPGEPKNFDEKTVDEVVKKVFNLAANVLSFYKMYEDKDSGFKIQDSRMESQNVLDRWIVARLDQLIETVTNGLDAYVFLESTRAIRDFIGDLSQWYLRRSRDRFKGDDEADKNAALATTRYVLLTLAKVMAPFAPFFAEELYAEAGGPSESVHLEEWPEIDSRFKIHDSRLVADMAMVRHVASKGLEARMKAKINVRQPLARLKVKSQNVKLPEEFMELIKDEVNVKNVVFDDGVEGDVELDTVVTPELREEGELRELLRKIQDLRKEAGLSMKDKASLTITADLNGLAHKHEDEIKKITNITDIRIGEMLTVMAE